MPFGTWLLASIVWSLSAISGWGAKIEVLATFAPLRSFAANVIGEEANLSVLIPANTGPHDYSFTPSDIKKISRADVVIMNGVNLESWLAKGLKSAGKKNALLVDTSRGINLITGLEEQKLAGVKAEEDSDSEGPNPHLWLSPVNAIQQVTNIRDALVARDPDHAAAYQTNTDHYLSRLKKLDADVRSATADIPDKNLITFHDTFPYFARDYGFTVAATFEEFPGKNPSPKAIEQLRKVIKEGHVKALFAEPQYSPKALDVLADEFKLVVVQLDPMETGDGSPDFYERVTRKNLDALIAAFHGAK